MSCLRQIRSRLLARVHRLVSEGNAEVVLIDFSHYEVVAAFIRILAPACRRVTVIAPQWIIGTIERTVGLEHDNLDLLMIPDESLDSIKSVERILATGSFDLCVVSTINENYEAWRRSLGIFAGKKIVVIHNANFWFQKRRHLKLFRVPRGREHRSMLRLARDADAVVALSGAVKSYIHEKYGRSWQVVESTTCIAGSAFKQLSGTGQLRLVVPGQIERHRRDYDLLLRAVKRIGKDRIALHLLGLPFGDYGQAIIETCRQMVAEGFGIFWNDTYVSQGEFDKAMSECSAILSPIVVETSYAGISETYGRSKITGVFADIVRYRIPAIVPASLQAPVQLESALRRYSSEDDLVSALSDMTRPEVIGDLRGHAVTNAEFWQPHLVRSRFLAELRAAQIELSPS